MAAGAAELRSCSVARVDFELTDEQRLVKETARAFTDNEIVARERENDGLMRALTGINALVPA